MENTIFEQAAKFLRERRNNRRWRIAVCCLAVFVVCGTAWVLSRNGQAFVSEGAVLDCPVVVHEHTPDCLDREGRPICGEADYVFHAHNEYCYDVEGGLVCKLEEIEAHEHSEDCFETVTTLTCEYGAESADESSGNETNVNDGTNVNDEADVSGEANVNSENASVQDESAFSVDSQALEAENGTVLICGMEEHTHSEDCCGSGERSLICGQEEGGHTHDDGCYEETMERKLACGKEEKGESEEGEEAGHTHSDECYEETTKKELACGQEENYHEHSGECYGEAGESELICGKTEHGHSETCYETQQDPGEQKPDDGEQQPDNGEQKPDDGEQKPDDGEAVEEPAGHVHDESCTQKVRRLVCGKKGVHIHNSEECYYGEGLICEVQAVRSVEEHNHDKDCFQTSGEEEFTKIYRDDTIVVTAVYTELAQIPEAARLRVEMIPEDSSDYEKDLAKLAEMEGALVEDSKLAMLLQIGFYTTDERILSKDTVHFTVQFLEESFCKEGDAVAVACFADSGVELVAASDIDKENATEFDLEEFADLDIGIIIGGERDRKRVLTYEGAGYIMSVALGEDTKVPEDAGLTIDQLTPENSPEGYANRLAQLGEADGILIGEDDMAMLMRVWVSAGGVDTGLDEKAEVTMQFLDDKIYAEGDAVMVASFDEGGVRLISGKDIDSEGFTTFEVDGLSEIAFIASKERAGVLTYEGEDYIVTVTLGAETRVPEGAELMVEEITQESDPALYAERLIRLEGVDGVLGEEEMIAHLLHMWVVLDGEEIVFDETVDVTVQFLNSRFYFEGDAVKAAHFTEEEGQQYLTVLDASDIDADISTSFVSEGLHDFAFVVDDTFIMSYKGDGYIVTVRFKETAKIPADAELIAKRITEESDPEQFAAREDQLQDEITDELIALGALFEIGFYDADGTEMEPQDVVDVKIQLLDRSIIEEADSIKVAHFVEEAGNEAESVEIIEEVDVTEDGDGSLSTSFQTESFSLYAITVNSDVINQSTLRKAIKLAQQGNSGSVKLMNDIVFYKTADEGDTNNAMPIEAGKSVTLDLNGYTITVDNSNGGNVTLFDIEGSLYITDSLRAGSVTKNAEGAKAPTFTYDNSGNLHHLKQMTCSVTESEVIDSSRGVTRETTYTYTVTGHGAIVGTNKDGNVNESPLLYVKAGRLGISGGAIVGDTGNRAVEMRYGNGWHDGLTATMTLDECYLVGCTAQKGFNGGEISGGAVYCGDSGTIHINNGAIISGNEARRGGGIYVTSSDGGNSLVNITGGYITNNMATFNESGRNYGDGGGGIGVNNAAIEMTGGYITGNKAYAGGAGIALSGRKQWRATKIINGTIASNYCVGYHGEGGGIALYDESIIEINGKDAEGKGLGKVYITNNEVGGVADWGGGGLFVGRDSSATLFDALITGNSADGFGGGLGGCSTGRIVEVNSSARGAAIFDNSAAGHQYAGASTKNEDHEYSHNTPTFWERDDRGRYYFQDLFSVLFTTVDNTMLGGGSEHWDGTVDGVRVSVNQTVWQSSYLSGLTAFPNDTDKTKAENLAAVYINGNYSAVHGGGIMCNGIMVIGENQGQIEIITAMELTGTKKLTGEDDEDIPLTNDQAGQFSFTVYAGAAYQGPHTHAEACRDSKNNLICGLEEGEPVFEKHEHISPKNKDGKDNPDSCYRELEDTAGGKKWELICGKGSVVTGTNGTEVITGNDPDTGNVTTTAYDPQTISFDGLLTFDLQRELGRPKEDIEAGDQYEYWYYIKEDDATEASANAEIVRDRTVYCMVVTVQKKDYGLIGLSNIRKYYDDIVGVRVYKTVKDANGTWSWSENPVHTQTNGLHNQYHAIKINMDAFSGNKAAFTNKKTDVKRIEVRKSWDYDYGLNDPTWKKEDEIEWVSVALFEKGKYGYNEASDPATGETTEWLGELTNANCPRLYLSAKNNWTASWDPLILPDGLTIDNIEVREIDIKYTDEKWKRDGKTEDQIKELEPNDYVDPAVWAFTPKYEYTNDGEAAKVVATNIPKTFGISFTKIGYNGTDGQPVDNGKEGAVYGAKFEIYQWLVGANNGGYWADDPMLFEQVNDGYSFIDAGVVTDRRTVTQLATNIYGKINISNLWHGKFLIKEVEAPVGYKPVHDHVIDYKGETSTEKVSCVIDGEVTTNKPWGLDENGHGIANTAVVCPVFAELSNQTNSDHDNGSQYFDYVNDVLIFKMIDPEDKYELPKTGGLGKDYIFMIGAIACFGIAVITYTVYRRRKGA